ncbi:MAG: RdgB/HAM1 family non-canonical purine NTP pyrophosphatase [Microcoleus sp. PH2017_10_PVI_O_A]|uniref:RdgB/HAM1 family non-canonical purine NTP pyrophosphatase n=1 Tax=unclassified Microcoleus TaxID=2642155 RepID=UPI001D62B3AE|nr:MULTISPECIES: RdgB/HAM1 family non-canonical purine NTP pyrophosphatase [unclassified Microcoleus]TAE85020.1 MAG: RdgB/HAM1 family non-canonical purine NTP pyrophosphatase [Oscillatoriales cyanobacterium]MCC3404841.1 RdgB/HAM1 family non-canonical purine NTP pyrophosphatase [Microcoleus sp. PH2017_10_PVI_O_A]MCC3458947.1 RdgB/HAM1 family non-canonical purine NTP pyrophosphatase [Microcoleus sp. PH2017_11_PCY_U_A]MCC3477148.1 RdgB/HAM1 family non-canonical purine NTP pyrophosphatase [Microcol
MTNNKLLVVATGNPGKLKEMQLYLQDLGWELQLKPEELEIEETGETFIANACLKASEVAKATGEWSIADDSGLMVDALDGQPGIYSARYGSSDADRISRLLKELGTEQNRGAQFVCAIAIARPDGTIALQVEGICRGEILHTPRGTRGFGYDPIFYVPAQQQTFAEMTPDIKRSHSHRGRAFEELIPQMANIVNPN